MRGIAILAVLFFHFGGLLLPWIPLSLLAPVVQAGAAGVDLFFVLSGFLITRILLDSRGTAHYFRNFYARRVLRIFPAYILVVGGFFWIAAPLAHAHGKLLQMPAREQLWYWLFLENWRVGLGYNDGAELPHLWSVAVEEQFYLFWSVIAFFFSSRRLARVAAALLAILFLVRLGLALHGVSLEFMRQATITRMDGLLAGAMLAASPELRRLASRAAPVLIPLGLAFLFFLHLLPVTFLTNAFAGAALVARASEGKFKVLSSRVLRSFGKYSYAIYLFHFIIVELLLRVQGRFNPQTFSVLALIFGLSLSYGLAWLSWRWLEHPCLRLKRYFPHPKQPRPPEPTVG